MADTVVAFRREHGTDPKPAPRSLQNPLRSPPTVVAKLSVLAGLALHAAPLDYRPVYVDVA